MKSWSHRLSVYVAIAMIHLTVREPTAPELALPDVTASKLLRETDPSEYDPEQFYAYMYLLGCGWLTAIPVVGVAMVLLGVALSFVTGGHPAAQSWSAVLLFVEIFLLAGALDTTWRFALAQVARRRYRRAGAQIDGVTERLLALARANDAAPVLQLLAATAAVILYT